MYCIFGKSSTPSAPRRTVVVSNAFLWFLYYLYVSDRGKGRTALQKFVIIIFMYGTDYYRPEHKGVTGGGGQRRQMTPIIFLPKKFL